MYVQRLRERYPPPTGDGLAEVPWRDLAGHPGFILIPYQSSTIMMFQLMALNVPIFAPSPALLEEWDRRTGLLFERVYGHPPRLDDLIAAGPLPPDPNSDDPAAVRYWIQLFEIYQYPHVQLFDSIEHLVELLAATDLMAVHRKMRVASYHNYIDLRRKLKSTLARLQRNNMPGHRPPVAGTSAADALRVLYGNAHADPTQPACKGAMSP